MKTQNLPDTITLHKQLQEIDADLRRKMVEVQTAYNELKQVAELAPIPTTITHITEAWLKSIIDSKCQLIEGDVSLTTDEKKSRKRAWFLIHARASKQVKTIIQALNTYQDAEWVFDEAINNYYCTNIYQVATARSSYIVPAEAKEHWQLITQAIEHIRKLRAWEDANDIKSQPLAYYQDLQPYLFIEAWINGTIKFDRRFAYLGINPQNFKDPHRPDRVII